MPVTILCIRYRYSLQAGKILVSDSALGNPFLGIDLIQLELFFPTLSFGQPMWARYFVYFISPSCSWPPSSTFAWWFPKSWKFVPFKWGIRSYKTRLFKSESSVIQILLFHSVLRILRSAAFWALCLFFIISPSLSSVGQHGDY